jgi:hypothetical protein
MAILSWLSPSERIHQLFSSGLALAWQNPLPPRFSGNADSERATSIRVPTGMTPSEFQSRPVPAGT